MDENVIKIADHEITIKRDKYLLPKGACEHTNTVLDENGQTVRCKDCGSNLNPYWVLKTILKSIEYARDDIIKESKRLREIAETTIVLKAAKEAQKAWQSRSMLPSCPHCSRGVLATDGFGRNQTNKEIELRRRVVEREKREKERGK